MKAELHAEGDHGALLAMAGGATAALVLALWVHPLILLATGAVTGGTAYVIRRIRDSRADTTNTTKENPQ